MITTKQSSRIGGRLLFAALLLGFAASAAGCEEAIESALCKSASNKICTKWFDCWPAASALTYGDVDRCRVSMDTFCDESESWTQCDVDNDSLRVCDQGIEGSPCGSLPYECTQLKDCHDAN